MSSDIAIKVENLSKSYLIYDAPRDRLKQFVVPRLQRAAGLSPKQYYREFWALKDVSFEVKKGETVGIIGRNGSGKSTLLQIICGTLNPTAGSVTTNGRIAALLELGSGFNPEFTGRENVYMSCALLGLTKEEIDNRFDEIAAFADIGDFIGQPVKTYSSGMFVRLAFAVNVVSSPDILVVDEALAVGDMNFQAKCMTALSRFQENGGSVLFVSHDVGAVKSLCTQAVHLEHGLAVNTGPAPEIADRYVRTMREEMNQEVQKYVRVSSGFSQNQQEGLPTTSAKVIDQPDDGLLIGATPEKHPFKCSEDFDRRVAATRYGSGGVRITYVELLDLDGKPLQMVAFNQDVKIIIYLEAEYEMVVSVNFNLLDINKINLTGCNFKLAGHNYLHTKSGGCYLVEYNFKMPLQEGNYSIRAHITSPLNDELTADFLDVVEDSVVFKVERWELAAVWSKVFLFPGIKVKDLSCSS